MEKFEQAISDCDTALSIDPRCTRTTIQKGNALLGLGHFDKAKEVYKSLRSLGDSEAADVNLEKLHNAQDTISDINRLWIIYYDFFKHQNPVEVSKTASTKIKTDQEKVEKKIKINFVLTLLFYSSIQISRVRMAQAVVSTFQK